MAIIEQKKHATGAEPETCFSCVTKMGLSWAEAALVKGNVFSGLEPGPMNHTKMGTARYFNNQTADGHLVQARSYLFENPAPGPSLNLPRSESGHSSAFCIVA